jgi:hypothetical protein
MKPNIPLAEQMTPWAEAAYSWLEMNQDRFPQLHILTEWRDDEDEAGGGYWQVVLNQFPTDDELPDRQYEDFKRLVTSLGAHCEFKFGGSDGIPALVLSPRSG